MNPTSLLSTPLFGLSGKVALAASLLALALPLHAFAAPTAKAPEARPPAAAKPDAAKPDAATKVFGVLVSKDGKRFELKGKTAVVGSAAGADVVIEDQTIAAKHVRFHNAGSTVTVEDLGSKFGTLAAGTAVTKGKPFRILQPIDIALGANLFRFEFGERPSTIDATQQTPGAGKGKGRPPASAGKKAGAGK